MLNTLELDSIDLMRVKNLYYYQSYLFEFSVF